MKKEINNYCTKVTRLISEYDSDMVDMLYGDDFNTFYKDLKKKYGSELYDLDEVNNYLDLIDETLEKNGEDCRILMKWTLPQIDEILNKFRPISAQIDFADVGPIRDDLSYLAKVNETFETFARQFKSKCQDLGLVVPDTNDEEYCEPQEKKQNFSNKLSTEEAKALREELIAKGYISSYTDENEFLSCFGCNKNALNNNIIWIKKNSRTKTPSKKSLLDLLVLLGYKEKEIKSIINNTFSIDGGNKFKLQDYNPYKDWSKDIKSEYHEDLNIIVNKIRNQKYI